jgi:hypothetical protein
VRVEYEQALELLADMVRSPGCCAHARCQGAAAETPHMCAPPQPQRRAQECEELYTHLEMAVRTFCFSTMHGFQRDVPNNCSGFPHTEDKAVLLYSAAAVIAGREEHRPMGRQ